MVPKIVHTACNLNLGVPLLHVLGPGEASIVDVPGCVTATATATAIATATATVSGTGVGVGGVAACIHARDTVLGVEKYPVVIEIDQGFLTVVPV